MSLEISAETSFALDLTNAAQYGPELHIDANAASDPNGNEADAITGWTANNLNGTGANVFESQSAVKNTGSYAFHIDGNDTPTALERIYNNSIAVDVASTYRITFNWRHIGTGGLWDFQCDNATQSSITSTGTSFVAVSVDYVATVNPIVMQFRENSATNNGGIYVDNFSIKKVL